MCTEHVMMLNRYARAPRNTSLHIVLYAFSTAKVITELKVFILSMVIEEKSRCWPITVISGTARSKLYVKYSAMDNLFEIRPYYSQ